MKKKEKRHDVIRKLIQEHAVKTQRELAELLLQEGFECTQATISRDVIDLGLVKAGNGCYVLPQELRLSRLVADLVEEVNYACNLVVVKTSPGAAQGVSAALDSSNLCGVLGTVAGDDTIMIAVESEEADSNVAHHIKSHM